MRIICLGGGPAGLYFSIQARLARPDWEVTVVERNRADDTFGWGVVFSDQTMGGFAQADAASHAEILRNFRHWEEIDVWFRGRRITSGGHGFCGIARMKLLRILQARAAELGVVMQHGMEAGDAATLAAEYDLVVGADGANSATRRRFETDFSPGIEPRRNRYIWLGTKRKLDAFTFDFRETPHGWFNLHAYRFDAEMSTFIVETTEETWRKAGLDHMPQADSIAYCETLFAERLAGERLISNASHLRGSAVWLKFNRILCERWHHRNVVLIGDAAHTAHFSIGSGTKLAMEDAIALARVLAATDGSVPERLQRYQEERETEALKLQSAARNRMEWFENVGRYVHLEPEQFAYSLLTGSQRLCHDNLRLRDPAYIAGYERWFAARDTAGMPANNVATTPSAAPLPPMFTPFRLRGLDLRNRVVVSPMAMYSCADGMPSDFHLVHLRARAGWCRTGDDGNDLRFARGAHHAGLCRPLGRSPAWSLAAHRAVRACADPGEDRHPAGSCRAERLDAAGLAGDRRTLAGRQLAADRALGHRLRTAKPGAARDDARGHGPRGRRLRGRRAPCRQG